MTKRLLAVLLAIVALLSTFVIAANAASHVSITAKTGSQYCTVRLTGNKTAKVEFTVEVLPEGTTVYVQVPEVRGYDSWGRLQDGDGEYCKECKKIYKETYSKYCNNKT